MTIFMQKIVTGGTAHKSRFHDEKGNLIDLAGLIYLPHCILTTLLRISTGWRPTLPWLGYRAIRRLERLIQPDWKIVEFGSGMSTLWFSQRCSQVVSIENDKAWYDRMGEALRIRGVTNVEYKLKSVEQFSCLDEYPDHYFDFILIDGCERGKCASTALAKVKAGGYIYLDNSDKHSDGKSGDTRIAEDVLLQAARHKNSRLEYFVDFIPTYLAVTQGLLVALSKDSEL
jgi:predicted O-methyltransferase YrrM